MTKEEFARWLTLHRAAFPGLSAWLARIPDAIDAPEGEPSRRDVLRIWFHVLEPCEYEDCKLATEAMAAGKIEEPRGWDRHKAAIRREADRRDRERRRQAVPLPRRVDGEPAFACPQCRDDGSILVYHPETYARAMGEGLADTDPIYRAVTRCPCAAGERWSWMLTYSPDRFCRATIGLAKPEQIDELIEWCEQDREARAF